MGPANPGAGILYEGQSTGSVARTTVAHSFGWGIANQSGDDAVDLLDVVSFNNSQDFVGFDQ